MNDSPAALIVIDVQQGLDSPYYGQRNNPNAEDNIERLLSHWRQHDWPVVHVQHASDDPDSPLRRDKPGFAFKPEAQPNEHETVFMKSVNSAFIGTPLGPYLREQEIGSIVIVGLTTDHCVSSSIRNAANIGFNVTLVEDATATFERCAWDGTQLSADDMHRAAIASLQDEFCRITTTAAIIES